VEALQALPEAERGPVLGPAAARNREDLEDMLAHIVRLEPQVARWPDLEGELAALRSAVQRVLRNLPHPMISVELDTGAPGYGQVGSRSPGCREPRRWSGFPRCQGSP
jgi:hypothetical protein